MSLLILPGDESLTTVVDSKDPREILQCTVQMWPYCYQLDTITYKDDNGINNYKFDIYVDESGLCKGLEENLCGTLAAHPLNEAKRKIIVGPCAIIPLNNEVKYTLDDWKKICKAVWYNTDLIESNCKGKLANIRLM
jgi:hypothetical protein